MGYNINDWKIIGKRLKITITYIYHSCFLIETDKVAMIFDYYKDNGYIEKIIPTLNKPIYIFSSHFHGDHFNAEIFKWKDLVPDIKYILSKDILEEGKAKQSDADYMEKGYVGQDGNITVKAYGSTDAGISFYIEAEGIKIFHAGDLNNWHWVDEAEAEESAGYEAAYHAELAEVAEDINQLDIVMFPVDKRLGTDYYKGAREFIEKIETDLFIPMHFGEDYASANAFSDIAVKHCKQFFEINEKYEKIEWQK